MARCWRPDAPRFGRLLALDAVAAVKLTETGIACEGRWARSGARPNRVGDARMAAAVELCDGHGSGVTQGAFGRLQLVAMPIVSEGAVSHVIAATAHPGRAAVARPTSACAAALAAHLASCLEMVAAVSAAREYMLLEQAIAPGQAARGDRALEQMQLVRSLAGAFIGVRSLPEVGRIVVGQLHTLIDYHSCRFYVVSQDGDLLLPAALMGVGEVYAGEDVEDLVVAVGEGITGRVFETRKPLRIDDASAVPFSVEIPGTEPIDESMLVAPMVSEHGSVGVIVLSKEGLARFDDDDLRLLEVIAAHAAIACENVRLIAEQQEAADISEALLELGAALSLQEQRRGHRVHAGDRDRPAGRVRRHLDLGARWRPCWCRRPRSATRPARQHRLMAHQAARHRPAAGRGAQSRPPHRVARSRPDARP